MGRGLLVIVCTVFLSGYALPVPVQAASWALDDISFPTTEKSLTDHGISILTQKDCALWRGLKGDEVCAESDDAGTLALASNESEKTGGKPADDEITALANVETAAGSPKIAPAIVAKTQPSVKDRQRLMIAGKRIWTERLDADLYYVIGSFSNQGNARRLVDKHRNLGPAVMALMLDGVEVYRVAVGPFTAKQKTMMRRTLKKAGIGNAWTMRIDHRDWMLVSPKELLQPEKMKSAPKPDMPREVAETPNDKPAASIPSFLLIEDEKRYLVIGSFSSVDNARNYARTNADISARVVSADTHEGRRHRVVIGPYGEEVGIAALSMSSVQIVTPAGAQSLEEALVAAYAGNPTLLAKRAELRSVDEGVSQALAEMRPSVTAEESVSGDSNYLSTRTSDPHQDFTPHSTSLTVSQSLYAGGQTLAAIGSAENTVLSGRAELTGVEQYVLLNAVKAYVNVFREQAVLDLRINNEQVLWRQLEAITDRFKVGEITRTDVHQAEARLAKATADRIQAEGNLISTRATYRNVIGETPGELNRPTMDLDLPKNAEEAIKLAVAQNPSVISAEFNERASQDDIKEVKGELLPSVDLTGSASRSNNALSESTRLDSYSVGITLSVPLFQSGSVYSRLRSARQTATKKRREIDAARRDATETAARAWETLQTSRAQIKSFDAQIKASEIALEGVQREASVGSRTVLDVLDAEQELLDAKVSIVSAQRDETIAIFELKSAIGELTARYLSLPVQVYDSAKHYNEVRPKLFGGAIAEDE